MNKQMTSSQPYRRTLSLLSLCSRRAVSYTAERFGVCARRPAVCVRAADLVTPPFLLPGRSACVRAPHSPFEGGRKNSILIHLARKVEERARRHVRTAAATMLEQEDKFCFRSAMPRGFYVPIMVYYVRRFFSRSVGVVDVFRLPPLPFSPSVQPRRECALPAHTDATGERPGVRVCAGERLCKIA